MFNFFKKPDDSDYLEIVARLTLSVCSILACRNVSASTDDVWQWLYSKGVRNEDSASELADEYEGK